MDYLQFWMFLEFFFEGLFHCLRGLYLNNFVYVLRKNLVQNNVYDKCGYSLFLFVTFYFVERLEHLRRVVCSVGEGFQLEKKHQRVLLVSSLWLTFVLILQVLLHRIHYFSSLSNFALGVGVAKLVEKRYLSFVLLSWWFIFHFSI